jgi:hypothetical protein
VDYHNIIIITSQTCIYGHLPYVIQKDFHVKVEISNICGITVVCVFFVCFFVGVGVGVGVGWG